MLPLPLPLAQLLDGGQDDGSRCNQPKCTPPRSDRLCTFHIDGWRSQMFLAQQKQQGQEREGPWQQPGDGEEEEVQPEEEVVQRKLCGALWDPDLVVHGVHCEADEPGELG